MWDLVHLLAFLLGSSAALRFPRATAVAVLATGVVSGLASTALVAVVNRLLSAPEPSLGPLFAGLCLALPATRFASQYLLIRLSQGAVYDLRMRLVRRLLDAPLRLQEKIGPARLTAVLTDDVERITAAAAALPLMSMNLAIVAGILVYLGWLSWQLLALLVAFLAVALTAYRTPLRSALAHLAVARRRREELFGGFRGLTEGFKELKIHRGRRAAFLARELETAAAGLRRRYVKAETLYALAGSWGQISGFVFLGLVLFLAARRLGAPSEVVTGYALGALYLVWPVESILVGLGTLGHGRVAAERIRELGLSLGETASGAAAPQSDFADWNRLELAGVKHTYYREDEDDTFALGPLELNLDRGELVFVVGGNGSGKTTLAKLLCGLYASEQGELLVDGAPVTEAARDDYRQLFSVVFSDFYLFEHLLGLELSDRGAAPAYLEKLRLAHKVEIRDRAFSTTDLSRGQRKRLALLVALLEDRDLCLFDEWAADQDPSFKDVFYRELLPELRERGKTVVVISHDYQYYDVADRIVALDYGRIVYDGPAASYRHGGRRA